MNDIVVATTPSRKTIVWRGFCERCPKCGQGAIYKSYLKVNAVCSHCAENFSAIRADDGPAWLTIILTGHIAIPLSIYLSMHNVMPKWLALVLLLSLTVSMALLILPRAKGIFIGVLWWLRQQRSYGRSKYDHLDKIP